MALEGNFEQKPHYRKRQEDFPDWVKNIPPEMFDAEGTLTREDIIDMTPEQVVELIDDAKERMQGLDEKLPELEQQAEDFLAENTERSRSQAGLIQGVIKGNRQNYEALGRKLELLAKIQEHVGEPALDSDTQESVPEEGVEQQDGGTPAQPEIINERYAREQREALEKKQARVKEGKEQEEVRFGQNFTVSFVDISERYENEIRDIARRRVDAETERDIEGAFPRMRKFFKRIGRNWFRDYYQRVAEDRAREEATENRTVFLEEEDLDAARRYDRAEREAIVEMFQNQRVELDEEISSNADGERFRAILEENEEVAALREQIEELVRDYVRASQGGQDEDTIMNNFMIGRDRILEQVRNTQSAEGLAVEGKDFADNLLVLARTVREGWDAESSLDQLRLDIDIQLGRSRDAIKGEVAQSRFESLMEKMRRTWVGSFVNEGTIGTTVALAFDIGKTAVGATSRTAAASMGLSALVTAGFSAVQEIRHLKQDRLRIGREMAKGYEGAVENMRERFGHREVLMHMMSVHDLGRNLHESVFGVADENGQYGSAPLEGEAYSQAVQALAEISARRQFSNREQVDLISYSDVTSIYQEKNELLVQYHETLAYLQSAAEQTGLELDVTQDVAERVRVLMEGFVDQQDERQKNFERLQLLRAGKAAARGAVIGATFAFGTQEVAAALSDSTNGLLERAWGGGQAGAPETVMGSAATTLSGWWNGEGVPADMQINSSFAAPGTYVDELTGNLYVNDQVILEGLPLDENGEFTEQTHQYLADNRLSVYDTDPVPVAGPPAYEELPVGEAVRLDERFVEVSGRSWLNNDTDGIYDFNELDLKWGAEDPDFYKMNIGDMTEQGSWRTLPDGTRVEVNWEDAAAEGKMYALISVSADSQNMVYPVQILPNGDINIPKDVLGDQLFSWETNPDTGQAEPVFRGKYVEAAYLENPPENIGDPIKDPQMLATYVGEGSIDQLRVETTPATMMVSGLRVEGVIPGSGGTVPLWIPNIYDRKAVGGVSLGKKPQAGWSYRIKPTSDAGDLAPDDILEEVGAVNETGQQSNPAFLPAQIGNMLPELSAVEQYRAFSENWVEQTPALHPDTKHLATVNFDNSVTEDEARAFLERLDRRVDKKEFAINIAVTNPALRSVLGEYLSGQNRTGLQVFAVDMVNSPFTIEQLGTEWKLANALILAKAKQQGIVPRSSERIENLDLGVTDTAAGQQEPEGSEVPQYAESTYENRMRENYDEMVKANVAKMSEMPVNTKASFIMSVQQKTSPAELSKALEALKQQQVDQGDYGYEMVFVFDTVGDPTWEEEVDLARKFNEETDIEVNIITIDEAGRETLMNKHGKGPGGNLVPWIKKRYAREIIEERAKKVGVQNLVINDKFPWREIQKDGVDDDFVLRHIEKLETER